jgi:hypothetical protein
MTGSLLVRLRFVGFVHHYKGNYAYLVNGYTSLTMEESNDLLSPLIVDDSTLDVFEMCSPVVSTSIEGRSGAVMR